MWAQEESRELRELKERLGVTARLESDLANASAFGDSGLFSSRDGNQTFAVGSRVRVIRGRHFRDFGAGDAGVVLRSDAGAATCTVAFDRGGEPLQVALRHLEPEPRRSQRSGEQARAASSERISSREELARDSRRTESPNAIRANSPERYLKESEPVTLASSTALERARRRLAESGTASSSSRRAASMPPQFGISLGSPRTLVSPDILGSPRLNVEKRLDAPRSPSRSPDGTAIDSSIRSILRKRPDLAQLPVTLGRYDLTSPLDVGSYRASPQERTILQPASSVVRSSPIDDVLRQQTAELRRAAEAAAAVELAAQHTRETMMCDSGPTHAYIAQQESQALAEAVHASATATATATANAVSEVSQLKLMVSEFQSRLSSEAEQRAASFRAIEKDIARLQSQHQHHYMETEDSLKAEQKRLARKQAELVSLCLSLQQAEDPKYESVNERITGVSQKIDVIVESQEASSKKLLSFESQVNDYLSALRRMTETERGLDRISARVEALVNDGMSQSGGIMELERSIGNHTDRLEALAARVDSLASLSTLECDIKVGNERMDSMAARMDTLFSSLAGKADRETLKSVSARVVDRETENMLDNRSVDALTSRVDRLTEKLTSETARLEKIQSKALEEAVTSLEKRANEQLQDFANEADRRVAQLKEAASEAENKAKEVLAALAEPSIASRPPTGDLSFKMTPVRPKSPLPSPSLHEVREVIQSSGYPSSMMASPSQQSFRYVRSMTPPPVPVAVAAAPMLTEPLARWAVGNRSGSVGPNQQQAAPSMGVVGADARSRDVPEVLQAFTARTGGSQWNMYPNPVPNSACPACGTPYIPDSVFCRKCGRKRDIDPQLEMRPETGSRRSSTGNATLGTSYGSPTFV